MEQCQPCYYYTFGEIQAKFNELYAKASQFVAKHNPCKVKDGKCGGLRHDFCCHDCKHLSPTGCTTRALACRIWYCSPSDLGFKETMFNTVKHLQEEAYSWHLFVVRGSERDTILRAFERLNEIQQYNIPYRYGSI